MGLAASQARFLCITARKADCEYKSTELAQEKLEITNQLSDASNEYSNAMDSTKLIWSNDAVDSDYDLSYSLLMTPSAINDYDAYMVTTASGAAILNSEYAAAARAAGISKAGGTGSQESRDKFIQALVSGGIVTEETADAITVNDYDFETADDGTLTLVTDEVEASSGITWNSLAGLGAEPKNKAYVDGMTLSELALSDSIGQKSIDWGQLIAGAEDVTTVEYNNQVAAYEDMISDAQSRTITNAIVTQLENDLENYKEDNQDNPPDDYDETVEDYENLISWAKKLMAGDYSNGYLLGDDGTTLSTTVSAAYAAIVAQLKADLEEYETEYETKYTTTTIDADGTTTSTFNPLDASNILINTSAYSLKSDANDGATYTIVENGIINYSESELNDMTIGDLLTSSIVLMANSNTTEDDFIDSVQALFKSIAAVFGYSEDEDLTGTGLNVDDASAAALEYAYKAVMKLISDVQCSTGSESDSSSKSMTANSAYTNAVLYNGIVSDSDGTYYAVSLSNLVSAFLTYYDNYLNTTSSDYVVGATTDTSVYVTDNSSYYYILQDDEDALTSVVEKSADFFDQLYNYICEHGWREDDSVDDSDYLQTMIKNGTYSLSSLNYNDGYYYQTRYNETGYLVEESDTDAIARAEAEYTAKKAELTYKEDSIDLKSKQLDAEISSLTTEYETVKTLISNNISKTFTLFQS